jgi:hypothetical protein
MLYAAVGLTALSVLLLELALTRIFSVVFYYHFAFLAISIALFGMGVGGVFAYFFRSFRALGWLAIVNAALVAVALRVVLEPYGELTNARLAAVYFAAALPFITSGIILSTALAETVRNINRVYFADLAGASLGCVLLIPLLNQFGGPNALLAVAVLFAVSAALWFRLGGAPWWPALVAAVLFTGLFAYNQQTRWLDVKSAKGSPLTDEVFVRWNSFSRISVRWEKGWPGPAIVIDADANTSMGIDEPWTWPAEMRRTYNRQFAANLPYIVRPGGKTLIIGPGGGPDVLQALASGSKDVTGVEINPLIANDIMRERYADVSKRLYFRPEVHIHVDDGRSFVRRSQEKYQILQATLVDTWASTAAGAFALSENSLYTVEAFEDYLNHLTPDGIIAFTRWGFEPPRESLRLLSLAREALRQLGTSDPRGHVIVVREGTEQDLAGIGARDTVLISRNPFGTDDLARVREWLGEGKAKAVYMPGDSGASSAFAELLATPDPKAWMERYRFNVSAVTDDQPFFFYTVQPRDLWNFFMGAPGAAVDYKINRAVPLLFGLLGISIAATLVMLFLPPLVLRLKVPARGRGALLYFVCVGVGFILIEVALIQKFVLFLGHPTYALTVVIFSLLLASGLGSYWSRRRPLPPYAVAVATAVLAGVLVPLLTVGVGWPFAVRVALTVLLLAPLGFLMGMPFPTGLARLEESYPQAIRWAWSLNAAASVLGSALAIFCAIYLGLTLTLLLGALFYVAAAGLRRGLTPKLS